LKKPPQKNDARGLALKILGEVLDGGAFASERLDSHLNRHGLSDAERSLCTQLVYGVLREKGFLDQVLRAYVTAARTPKAQARLLALAVYQGLFLEKIPDYALVNESVESAKANFGIPASRMVNAVLRRFLADREKWRSEVPRRLPQVLPAWLYRRWQGRYAPERLSRMLQYYQGLPPIGLRVHAGRADPDRILNQCRKQGLEGQRWEGSPILLLQRYDRNTLQPWLLEGLASVQDPHSYQIAAQVAARVEDEVLDVCAGHGGKSSAIAEQRGAGSKLWVHEPQAQQLRELRENFQRLGLDTPLVFRDSQAALESGRRFDWILIDAPCSGLGTLGRKPEIRWRVQEMELQEHGKLQAKILQEWSPLLKPGGRLVYAVCSLEPEEGEGVIRGLLAKSPDLELLESRELSPADSPGDGFFLANLRRRD